MCILFHVVIAPYSIFFFFTDTSTTEIYTLSLHDALPILLEPKQRTGGRRNSGDTTMWHRGGGHKRKLRIIDFKRDRKSTRLNSSHTVISYAVFCLKKKKKKKKDIKKENKTDITYSIKTE